MHKEQKMIISEKSLLEPVVNRGYLKGGWRIVPNSIGAASLRKVGNQFESKLENGESFDHIMWCVVERDCGDE